MIAGLQNCLESAVESGNFDSLRTLCLAIHGFNLELKAVIPPLVTD